MSAPEAVLNTTESRERPRRSKIYVARRLTSASRLDMLGVVSMRERMNSMFGQDVLKTPRYKSVRKLSKLCVNIAMLRPTVEERVDYKRSRRDILEQVYNGEAKWLTAAVSEVIVDAFTDSDGGEHGAIYMTLDSDELTDEVCEINSYLVDAGLNPTNTRKLLPPRVHLGRVNPNEVGSVDKAELQDFLQNMADKAPEEITLERPIL